jgi:hypothetical protein
MNKFSSKISKDSFKFDKDEIVKIVHEFPLIKNDIVKLEAEIFDKLSYGDRKPGDKKEHLEFMGLCGEFSGIIINFIKSHYDCTFISGGFILDKYPSHIIKNDFYTDKIKNKIPIGLHSWTEINGKIFDISANQFQTYVDEHIPDLIIGSYKDNSRYIKGYDMDKYYPVMLNEDDLFENYINKLSSSKKNKKEISTKVYPREVIEDGFFRRNYDYGDSPYFGKPGGGEKSMRDWLNKKRKKKQSKASNSLIEAAEIYLNWCLNG